MSVSASLESGVRNKQAPKVQEDVQEGEAAREGEREEAEEEAVEIGKGYFQRIATSITIPTGS